MPLVSTNGSSAREDAPASASAAFGGGNGKDAAADGAEEALVWDTGLSQFLGRLEEDLIRWHSEERIKTKDRQLKCLRAQKDLVTVEASVRETSAAQRLKGSEEKEAWQDKVQAMLKQAKEQREEMRQMVELMRGHAKLHLEQAGSPLLAKLPAEGQPLGLGSDELPKHAQTFLDLADRQAATTTTTASARYSGGKESKGRKEKRKANDKKGGKKAKERRVANVDDDYSYLSSSRSQSPSLMRTRRRERRGRHRRERYTPSCSCSSDSRSLSQSRSPSREYHRQPRTGPGARAARRGGGGGGGREDARLDIPAEVDRFVRINKLEGRCEKILRELSPALARRVMGLSGGSNTFELSGDVRDPTAVVLARIRKAREEPRRGGGGGGGGGSCSPGFPMNGERSAQWGGPPRSGGRGKGPPPRGRREDLGKDRGGGGGGGGGGGLP